MRTLLKLYLCTLYTIKPIIIFLSNHLPNQTTTLTKTYYEQLGITHLKIYY